MSRGIDCCRRHWGRLRGKCRILSRRRVPALRSLIPNGPMVISGGQKNKSQIRTNAHLHLLTPNEVGAIVVATVGDILCHLSGADYK